MKVAAIVSPDEIRLQDAERPRPGPKEILLKVERVGICGSDFHAWPESPPNSVIGHEFIGTIVEVGESVTKLKVGNRVCSLPCIGCGQCKHCLSGDPVHCETALMHGSGTELGAFGEYVLAGEQESLIIPEDLSLDTAALIEPLAVGLHLVERAEFILGDKLIVLGAGPIGLTAVIWAKHFGVTDILVSDPVQARRDLAMEMGATAVVDPINTDLHDHALELWGELPRVVIECMGRTERIEVATEVVSTGGKIILGGFMFEPDQFRSFEPFFKGISMEFVPQYRMQHFEYTLAMLIDGQFDPSPMISAKIRLNELPDMMQTMRKPHSYCKVLVAPAE